MRKRYKKANLDYKALYFSNKIAVKSYLTGFVFAFLICLLIYLPLVNLLFLTQFFIVVSLLIFINTLFLVYLLLFFKDKALIEYVPEAKNVDLFIIRLVDFITVAVICSIVYIVVLVTTMLSVR